MSTMPGAVIIPKTFGQAMVLFTAGDRVEAVVDGAPAGPNGRLFIIEPNKAHKVPYEAGRFILEHLPYTGVVRVEETESDTGTTYDIEKAKQESLALLAQEDKRRFDQYVRDCVSDYIANPKGAKPVPAPSGPILAIIKRRGYDLKSYGIVPLGWETPDKDGGVTALAAENAALKQSLADLTARVNAMSTPPAAPPAQPPSKKG
jgi:hypothetical protein